MDKQRLLLLIVVFTTTLIVPGCAALLPRSSTVVNSPWKSYIEAVEAFDSVVPTKSTVNDIGKLGFNIHSTSNLKILSYVDIAVATQTLKREELGNGIDACLRVRELCTGYVFEPQVVKSHRYGNFLLDIFNFKRETKESGWKLKATFLVVDSVVVEKFWYGEPLINLDRNIVNPLGPLQEIGNIISFPKISP